ncbi:MAG: isoprenylcysteine carboxylmethyltransferase family protein [Brevundimonas sp.]|jgi:protein-S-isoprenylcysteine O-methyltransferase Ste14|uniref:methyltransferase family protein n=1 Tax=Brevundimonas sp. TaxID=1871086 RepID=UPI0017EADF6D|nr:isoprenylcysteine carboxylmethyltransferase family protein [Brevundimonas sp.]MBA4804729.1 isoprenylcysteine carboxylmethyltransferase family protein [Brevundimonas sp.]
MNPTPFEALDLGVIQKMRKVAVAMALLLLLGLSLVSQSIGGVDGAWHESVEAAGLAAIVFSIVGRAWCTLYIGGRKKAVVVDRGPYSITRNPLYVFSFFGAFGIGAQSGSLTIAVAFVLAAMLVFHFTVRREEAWLQREFGAAYAAYARRTPRFWPRFDLWRDADELTIRPSLFLLTIRDGLVFLLAIPLFELIDAGQSAHWLKVLAHLP